MDGPSHKVLANGDFQYASIVAYGVETNRSAADEYGIIQPEVLSYIFPAPYNYFSLW